MGRRGLVAAAVLVTLATVVGAGPLDAASSGTEGAAAALAAFVPEEHRYACQIADPADPVAVGRAVADRQAAVAAVLECGDGLDSDVVDYVAYVRFTTLDAMNAVYREYAQDLAGAPPRSSDGECPGERTWSFEGRTAGSVACYYGSADGVGNPIDERAALVWTYDDELILGLANTPAAEADALSTWWEEDAGPSRTAGRVAGLAATPGVSSRRAEQRLRKHVPTAFRRSCRPLDVGDPASVGDLFHGGRLFVGAGLLCAPSEGADRVRYYSVGRGAIDGFFEAYHGVAPDAVEDCPGTGTWSLGSGRRQREVGEYSCWQDDATAAIAWSQRELGIVAVAVRGDGDFDRLFAFWNDDAGPV